jgi:hypothetical protein
LELSVSQDAQKKTPEVAYYANTSNLKVIKMGNTETNKNTNPTVVKNTASLAETNSLVIKPQLRIQSAVFRFLAAVGVLFFARSALRSTQPPI